MGGKFERSERLEHQTLGVQRLAVHSEDYWEYKPEQRVKTIDGVTGVVKHVEDGPFPGWEEYEVELDKGLGGGRYTASQLSPAPITTEAMEQTAAVDYPELSQVLVERPDPARQFVTAGKNPFADDDSDEGDDNDEPDSDDSESDDDSDGDDSKDSDDDSSDKDGDDDSDDGDDAPPWAKKASTPAEPGTARVQVPGAYLDAYQSDPHPDAPAELHELLSNAPTVGEGRNRRAVLNVPTHLAPHLANVAYDHFMKWGDEHKAGHPTRHVDAKAAFMVYNQAKKHTAAVTVFSDLVVTAATDADFRFHVTAAWRDVVAKAKRIRSEGRLRVTLASDGYVFAEVKGDHHVYETGLQRLPGRVSAQSWSCGCKWGAYHWGADDDFSRFAGRMCSHALALQYEAQSRGMFGRDVNADEHKPTWVPRHVVVRYDIDADTNRLAPSTAAARPSGSAAPLSLVARAAVAAGEDQEELLLALSVAGIRPLANADSPFGDPAGTSYVQPKAPGATAPRKAWENPASAGPLSGADPAGWNRQLPLQSYAAHGGLEAALFEPGGTEAELHDEPEGALPSTDGSVPTDEASDLTPSMTAGLKRQALKDFTLAEQQALINEGEGVRAANLDRLDIKGTHYADLEHVLAAQEEDTTWLA